MGAREGFARARGWGSVETENAGGEDGGGPDPGNLFFANDIACIVRFAELVADLSHVLADLRPISCGP